MTAASDIIAASMSEADWQKQVLEWAFLGGWKVYAMHDSRQQVWGTDPGFPDLFMVRGERSLAAELKTANGFVGPAQRTWHLALNAAGIQAEVWRPQDAQRVEAVLLDGISPRDIVRRAAILKSRVSRATKTGRSAAKTRATRRPKRKEAPDGSA